MRSTRSVCSFLLSKFRLHHAFFCVSHHIVPIKTWLLIKPSHVQFALLTRLINIKHSNTFKRERTSLLPISFFLFHSSEVAIVNFWLNKFLSMNILSAYRFHWKNKCQCFDDFTHCQNNVDDVQNAIDWTLWMQYTVPKLVWSSILTYELQH